jgi:hypothetical protein
MPSSEDAQLWNECKAVTFLCSIEAVGPQFEYIRYPLKWDEVSQNIANFSKLFTTKFTLTISPNLGIHNALEYPKLVGWFQQIKTNSNHPVQLEPNPTVGSLSFDRVSAHVKKRILKIIPNSPEYQTLRSYIINSIEKDNTDWIRWLDMIDSRRGLNWRETFPDLVGLVGI